MQAPFLTGEFDVGEAGLELTRPEAVSPGHPFIARLEGAMRALNRIVMVPCMGAVYAAACILTCSVAACYFFKIPTDWQDEMVVFLLIGAIFFSGAYVQSLRGHVGDEAVAGLLSARLDRVRMLCVGGFSFLL